MISKTRGIVLHRIRYSESSIIAKIYTEQFGLCSCLAQGARKKKSSAKANLLQPLSLIELVMYHKETSGLQKVKELKGGDTLFSVQSDMAKTAIALFLSEMLARSLREETPNKPLFDFLYESVKTLDAVENPASFHLLFLVKLSKFLGFYPHGEFSDEKMFFNLPEGIFVSEKPHHLHYLDPEFSVLLRHLMSLDFDQLKNFSVDGKKRKILLEKIIDYYRLHLAGFHEIKSHGVLETVLRG